MPREAANALSLEGFKARLHGALISLVYLSLSLAMAWELELKHLKLLSQPKPFYDMQINKIFPAFFFSIFFATRQNKSPK